ncbi:MAG TPA: hypothetical protein VLD39_06930, partial [Gammaproteobacteria bacterium]|nr:hypothetical protein [Gammaproteobacteria bacterium]
MRTVLVCLLLGGCSLIDGVVDDGARNPNRVFLGSDSVVVSMHDDLDRYTCGAQPMICDRAGSKWACSCDGFSLL